MVMANERFERGEYSEAAQQYESLIDHGYSDLTLYFNLGNAYLESDDLGRAILNYLRALVLSPRDPDILTNLDLARSQTVDQIEVERVSLVESFAYLGRRALNPSELGLASLLLWALSGLSIAALIVWRDLPLRRLLRSLTGLSGRRHTSVVPATVEHAVRQSLRKHRSRNRSNRRGFERSW